MMYISNAFLEVTTNPPKSIPQATSPRFWSAGDRELKTYEMHACRITAKYTLQLEHYHTAETCYFTSTELYKQIVKRQAEMEG